MAAHPVLDEQPFGTVLLATDLTAASAAATDRAIELAAQLGARLLVVNVVDGHRGGLLRPLGVGRPVEDREDHAAAAEQLVERARLMGTRASWFVWDGDPGEAILAAAEAEGADLIVMGTRGRGTMGRLFGSVSDYVLRRATVPVVVARPDESAVDVRAD